MNICMISVRQICMSLQGEPLYWLGCTIFLQGWKCLRGYVKQSYKLQLSYSSCFMTCIHPQQLQYYNTQIEIVINLASIQYQELDQYSCSHFSFTSLTQGSFTIIIEFQFIQLWLLQTFNFPSNIYRGVMVGKDIDLTKAVTSSLVIVQSQIQSFAQWELVKKQLIVSQQIQMDLIYIQYYYFKSQSMAKGVKAKKGVKKAEKKANPLFEKRPRNFRVGNSIQPTRNLTRFVKWPKYITFQRQKRILLTRIKVPPAIAQFSRALDKNQANVLFRLLKKYSPEDTKQRKARLVAQAKLKAEKKEVKNPKPYHLKFGLNHVTKLIEEKKAKLVVIANNVDPIELVVWLPNLCRKLDIPYCFVKGKSALGRLVHQKNAAVVALTDVRKEDEGEVNNLAAAFRSHFNENKELGKLVGGFKRGAKSEIKYQKMVAEKEKEAIKKLKA